MSDSGEVAEMPNWSSTGIFLSYRREDAGPYARLLQSELRERFPGARVFMDLDSIEAGLDFAEVIREAVESCAVVVALIGRQWATLTDEEGSPRLNDPDDFVRFEIEAALARGVRVIPVLVDGARPLRQQQLPGELGKLARLNALELSYSRYQYDADKLLDLIRRLLAAAPRAGSSDTAATPDDGLGAAQSPDDKLEAAVHRLASSAASPNIGEAIDGLLALGYKLKPPRTVPGKRPENYLRFIDPKYPSPAVGYLTPRTFSFSRTADRDRLKDLPGAWVVSNAVNLSHEQSVREGLDVARKLKG
jgi:TIR domain